MKVEKIKIEEVKPNPKNPRTIRDDKFKKLVQSLVDFPEMMKIRPIVTDENLVVLGGNMRLKAAKEAGLKEVWIQRTNFTESEKKEFLIKDNVEYGNWDYLLLKDFDALESWGMDIPEWAKTSDFGAGEADDFFNDDFLTDNSKAQFEPERKEEYQNSINTAYFLLMLESADWNFLMDRQKELQKRTGTTNLSDAIQKIVKEYEG